MARETIVMRGGEMNGDDGLLLAVENLSVVRGRMDAAHSDGSTDAGGDGHGDAGGDGNK
jgi:hypothetical protein